MAYKLGLIGYPVKHSLSPWIHQQFLTKAGLAGEYSIEEIAPNDSFKQEVERIKSSQFDGFNVTVPYKKQIIPYLDHLDKQAQAIGAVNTVVRQNKKWIGYNTDGAGYITGLKHYYPSIFANKQCSILLIGAGGAARGIFHSLAAAGFTRIDIANRTRSSAENIAASGGRKTKTSIITLKDAAYHLSYYDLIIQTTNVGMRPNVRDTVISLEHMSKDAIVSDIVYQPIETEFLHQAGKKGASVHYGHTMLLYQAQYAFELWTSKKVPLDDMEQQLQNILEGR
ncbi:shikimate dehydrogenase [Lentibacillus halodurans]|uniref:Shikimate dehydrogenase (NADP(+)) n=1 Tax=Lentibacillus halodurans TaxID=237679 RepID=A0A1I0V0G9_9BACI|nr:shikimate dehydrogenase [Lentibacillus halodurans]SFA69805.1 shikimate dehydrogenase [Lentibacillus halodurans]